MPRPDRPPARPALRGPADAPTTATPRRGRTRSPRRRDDPLLEFYVERLDDGEVSHLPRRRRRARATSSSCAARSAAGSSGTGRRRPSGSPAAPASCRWSRCCGTPGDLGREDLLRLAGVGPHPRPSCPTPTSSRRATGWCSPARRTAPAAGRPARRRGPAPLVEAAPRRRRVRVRVGGLRRDRQRLLVEPRRAARPPYAWSGSARPVRRQRLGSLGHGPLRDRRLAASRVRPLRRGAGDRRPRGRPTTSGDAPATSCSAPPGLPAAARRPGGFTGLPVPDYDPAWRFEVDGPRRRAARIELDTGTDGAVPFERLGIVRRPRRRHARRLAPRVVRRRAVRAGQGRARRASPAAPTAAAATSWTPSRAPTSARPADGPLVLDFNFAYNPSCAYDPAWACPLAQPGNTVGVEVPVGERG